MHNFPLELLNEKFANIQQIPISTLVSTVVGGAMVATSAFSVVFNCLVIKTMTANEELYRLNSYKFMIALGISDVVQLCVHLITGIFTMARISAPGILNQLLGSLITPAYIFYSTLSVVLSFDRFLLTFSPPTEYWLFSSFAMKLWLAGCVGVSLAFSVALASPNAAILYAWPLFSWAYDASRPLSRLVQLLAECVEIGGIFISATFYILIFIIIGQKRNSGTISKGQMRNRFDLRILIQSFTISTYCMLLNVLWHNYEIFLPDSVFGYAALNFVWIGNSAVNPLIYIIINGTLRQKFSANTALVSKAQRSSLQLKKATREVTRALVARHNASTVATITEHAHVCQKANSANNGHSSVKPSQQTEMTWAQPRRKAKQLYVRF